MRAEALMTRAVCACRPTWSLERVARALWDSDCGCSPVVDDENHILGMITDRDICMAALMQGRPLTQIDVRSAMSRAVHHCKPTDSLEAVVKTMREHHVRRVPIVDDAKQVVGIISLHDFATAAICGTSQVNVAVNANEVTRTLAEICRPRFDRTAARGD